MSAFLAPIHYNVFNKIKNQENIIEDLINDFSDENLRKEVYEKYGKVPSGDLEDIINLENIHGWLETEFTKTEKALSFVVKELLQNIELDELKKWFYDRGSKFSNIDSPNDIFITFSTFYMDGMPCDRAISPLEFSEEKGSWQLNIDVHKKYWEDEGIIYNELRNSWLEGLSNNNGFNFSFKNNIYEVTKCTA